MNTAKIIQLFLIILLAIIIFKLSSCEAGEVDGRPDQVADLLHIIAKAESSNGKFLYGDDGKSLGKFHICAAVVKDYNKANRTTYKHTDLLDNKVSEKTGKTIDETIAHWHAWQIVYVLERRGVYSVAKFCHLWNSGAGAVDRPLPRSHRNLIYSQIYKDYYELQTL